MTEFVCNYALIRFLPYRDAGEFINIGVALTCAPLGYFDFHIEANRTRRVTQFFPEMEKPVYSLGLKALQTELERLRQDSGLTAGQTRLWAANAQREDWTRQLFAELVRPREALFHCAAPGTVLTTDPEAKLTELFDYYVRRQWTDNKVTTEEKMQKRITGWLRDWRRSMDYKEGIIGDKEKFYVTLPFVARRQIRGEEKVLKVIRQLDLDKAEPNDIYQHGGAWVQRLERLKRMGFLDGEWLFPVKTPKNNTRRIEAAQEICRELEYFQAKTVDFADTNAIQTFAALPELASDSILSNK